MSHFRWLTTDSRTLSVTSGDYYTLDGDEDQELAISSENHTDAQVRMIVAFHSPITHEESTQHDVMVVLQRYPHLVNDEIYLDETKEELRARGVSPLRNALLYGKWSIAQCLVEHGANLYVLIDHKICVLSYACIAGQFKLVRAMLDRNRSKNFRSKKDAPTFPRVGSDWIASRALAAWRRWDKMVSM